MEPWSREHTTRDKGWNYIEVYCLYLFYHLGRTRVFWNVRRLSVLCIYIFIQSSYLLGVVWHYILLWLVSFWCCCVLCTTYTCVYINKPYKPIIHERTHKCSVLVYITHMSVSIYYVLYMLLANKHFSCLLMSLFCFKTSSLYVNSYVTQCSTCVVVCGYMLNEMV